MNNNLTGRSAAMLGIMLLAVGLAVGFYTGGSRRPGENEIDVPELEEAPPIGAEEKFDVVTVNIFACGHIVEKPENMAVSAGGAEALMESMGGYSYELRDGRMALYREFDYCCPEHYCTEKAGGTIAVYKTDDETLRRNEVCRLDVPAGAAVFEEIGDGMLFDGLEDINLYIEGMDE